MAMAGWPWPLTALPPPGICVTKSCAAASARQGTACCRQAGRLRPVVKWLKSRGQCTVPAVAACTAALMTRSRGARSRTNDTQRDTKPFPRVILAVPSDRWMEYIMDGTGKLLLSLRPPAVLLQQYRSSGRAREQQTNHMLD